MTAVLEWVDMAVKMAIRLYVPQRNGRVRIGVILPPSGSVVNVIAAVLMVRTMYHGNLKLLQ